MLLYYELVAEDAGIPTKLGLTYSLPEARPFVACGNTGWFRDNCCIFLPLASFFFFFPLLVIKYEMFTFLLDCKILHVDSSK